MSEYLRGLREAERIIAERDGEVPPALMVAISTARTEATKAEPVVWIIPGDDGGRESGFVDAMAWQHGEFSRPLYAAPPSADSEYQRGYKAGRKAERGGLDKACDIIERAAVLLAAQQPASTDAEPRCSTCNGLGIIVRSEYDETCSKCGGSGKVPAPLEAPADDAVRLRRALAECKLLMVTTKDLRAAGARIIRIAINAGITESLGNGLEASAHPLTADRQRSTS